MYVICASPAAKIFMVPWQKRLMEEFDLVYDEKFKFHVSLKTSHGEYKFNYNEPKMLVGKPGVKSEIDWAHFGEWLTGGDDGMQYGNETDMLGIVKLPVQSEVTGLLAQMIESGEEPTQNVRKTIMESRNLAKKIASDRIKKATTRIYLAYKKQKEIFEEDKKVYLPSPTEYLCVRYLSDEIRKTEGAGLKFARETEDMLNKMKDSNFAITAPGA